MAPESPVVTVLSALAEKLEGIEYAFIGSTNLYVQGLHVNPRDIDILTTSEGIRAIDSILAPYRTKEVYFDESDGRNSFRSFYVVGGFEVEVLGNVSNAYRAPESLTKRIRVRCGEGTVPCIPLEEELAVYEGIGRAEKVTMIREFLETQARG